MRAALRRLALFVAAAPTLFSVPLVAQVQQQAAAAPAGTLQLTSIAPAARDALFASYDAFQSWSFNAADKQADRALAVDSTFGLARALRARWRGATTAAALDAELVRAMGDAAARPVPELTLVLAHRAAGVNASRLLGAAAAMQPNDRRVALEYALSLTGKDRLDSLRHLDGRFADFAAPRIWLAYYLTFDAFPAPTAGVADEALTVAKEAVRIAPNLAGAHAAMAHVLERTGKHEQAMGHLRAAKGLDAEGEYTYTLEAEIHARENRPEQARAALDSAILYTPSYQRRMLARQSRAYWLLYEGKASEAMTELGAAARDAEADGATNLASNAHATMAMIAAGVRDSTAADANLAEARRLAPDNPRVGSGPSVASLLKRGAIARAGLPAYLASIQSQDSAERAANTHFADGMTLFAEGKPQEAITELRQARDNPWAVLFLAESYLQLGNEKQAADERAAFFARKNFAYDSFPTAILKYRADHPR